LIVGDSRPGVDPLVCLRDRSIVLVSHDLTRTGSPLLLAETAVWLREKGAKVQVATLADDSDQSDILARDGIALLPIAESFSRAAQADLVIANTAEASTWVDRYLDANPGAGASLVWWIHEIDAASYASRVRSLGRAAMAIFDSHASLENWRDAGFELPRVARVVHPGVEESFLARAHRWRIDPRKAHGARILDRPRLLVREDLGIGPRDFVVTLVGTYGVAKGHDLFVDTVAGMLEGDADLALKVLLVGFHHDKERLTFLSIHDGPARRALDHRRALCEVSNLAPYYAASDAFVMNTQGPGENFGRVTLEAMAFGLPVLATEAGGTPEIVEDGVTGLLHPVGRVGQERLAANLLGWLKDRQLAATMGEAGRRRVRKRFTDIRFHAELGDLLAAALRTGGATPLGQPRA
jgi:glycosyltransferase involved in cell wall biosynthesis